MDYIADKYWATTRDEGYGVSDGAGVSMEVEDGKRIVRDRTTWFFKDLPHLHHARQLAYILNATKPKED